MNKTFILFLLLPIMVCALDEKKEYAQYLGHLLWERSLKDRSINYEDILNGFKEASQKLPPKISDEEAMRIFFELEKQQFEELAERNLQQSVVFLKEIASQNEMVPIVENKVYMKILQEGIGEGLLAHEASLFKLKAYRPNETPFYENKEGIMQALDVAIEGFAKGALGMKIGEKRIIYIHPEHGYGTYNLSHPNTVVIVEAERLASKGD